MIDLNQCKPGDKLRIRATEEWKKGQHNPPTDIVTYVGKLDDEWMKTFPHEIQYSNGSWGTRTDEGWTFRKNRLPDDPDVIEIL